MDNPKTGPKTGKGQKAPEVAGSGGPRADAGDMALFQTGRELQRLADDWVVLRRDAFLLGQRLRGVEDRLVMIEGQSTGDAHAKLALLALVLQHDLGLAPDHRALPARPRRARGAGMRAPGAGAHVPGPPVSSGK